MTYINGKNLQLHRIRGLLHPNTRLFSFVGFILAEWTESLEVSAHGDRKQVTQDPTVSKPQTRSFFFLPP